MAWSRVVSATIPLLLVPTAAISASDWIASKDDTGFGIKQTTMAVGSNSVLLISCEDDELSVIIGTPEEYDDTTSPALSLVGPQAIIAIDGGAVQKFDASIMKNGLGKMSAEVADGDQPTIREIVKKLFAAKKNVAFGLEVGGKKYHASKVSSGSKKIQSVLSACAEKSEPEKAKPSEDPETSSDFNNAKKQ